jgi:hypothetical protein
MQASHEDSLTEHVPSVAFTTAGRLRRHALLHIELDLGVPPYTVESSRANQAG